MDLQTLRRLDGEGDPGVTGVVERDPGATDGASCVDGMVQPEDDIDGRGVMFIKRLGDFVEGFAAF